MAHYAHDTKQELAGSGGIHVTERIEIDAPIEVVYAFWRDLTNLPRTLSHVRSVTPIGSGRTHWVVDGPLGKALEWDAETINEVPNQVIGWRSVGDADIVSAGSVNFDRRRDDTATLVTVKLQYDPPAGRAGAWVSSLLGSDPGRQIAEDLRRLKAHFEGRTAAAP